MGNSGEEEIYEFEEFRLDAGKRLLLQEDGEPVPLMPKAFEILLFLVKKAGTVIEKDELMEAIWPDTAVEENNLTQNISALRRVLGEKHRENRFIATVPGRGYKFVAEVREVREVEARPTDSEDLPAKPQHRGKNNKKWWLVGAAAAILFIVAAAGYLFFRENSDSPARSVRSIAILPFKPITAENRDEALETGMADTLITKLSGSEELTVRPLAAVRRFSSPEQDPAEAGRQLGVESVLDGGVQISGGRVRVSAKLIRSEDGRQLWAEQFDEPLGDIFSVQDSISQRVAAALRISLANLANRSFTNNVEAYQLFLRGRLHASRLILPELQKGISFYEQAIAVDPTYAHAYAELSNAYRAMVLTNDAPPLQIMPKALAAATKAVELDKDLPDAWTSLGSSEFWYRWDWEMAEKHFVKAINIDPSNASAHTFYAHLLSNIGRHEAAIARIQHARELDPLNFFASVLEGQILCLAGRDDESLQILRSAVNVNPDFWLAHLFIARTYMNKGMWPEAIAAANKAREITNGNAEATGTVGYALGRSGDLAGARRILSELEDAKNPRYIPAYTIAQVYLGMGDRAKALEQLEKAYEGKETLMVFLGVEPRWNELRSEPRFKALISRMEFE